MEDCATRSTVAACTVLPRDWTAQAARKHFRSVRVVGINALKN
jgi:hypothetical protein